MFAGLLMAALTSLTTAGDALVRWGDGELQVGNKLFTRTYVAKDGDLVTTSLRRGGYEWIDAKRVPAAKTAMQVTAVRARRHLTGAEGVRVTVTIGANVRTLWVFPKVPGVILESPKLDACAEWKENTVHLYDNLYSRSPKFLKGADVLKLRPLHLMVTEYVLQDMTDIRNELVECNSWLLMTRESPLARRTPIITVEDTLSGEGLVAMRLAPLPHDRPDETPDFMVGASEAWKRPNQAFFASIANGYPVAELAYAGGKTGRIRALQAMQRALRQYLAGRDGIFLSNTWGDSNRDARINADFIMAEIKAGGELGVDVIQIDDGWQTGKSANSALLKDKKKGAWAEFRAANPDFWKLDPEKFPQGIAPLVEAAAKYGMGFGLWFGPDKTDDYAGWELDVQTLREFYKYYGIRYFKIDGISMESEKGFANIRKLFDQLLADSKGSITFDLDVTGAVKRPGYFGVPDVGPLFVENRYINQGSYWPHFTLRNLWTLSQVIDPLRLRMELANPLHGMDKFGEDPLAPKRYRGDTLFAMVMIASPLGWMELSELSPRTVEELKPLIATWKRERANLHGGVTFPVGAAPDGIAWTGFVTDAADGKSAYALVFRELNEQGEYALDLSETLGKRGFTTATVLAGRGTAALSGDTLKLSVSAKLDYLWVKLAWR